MKFNQGSAYSLLLFAGYLLQPSCSELCDPSLDRHCEPFLEKNVESVNVVATEVVQEPVVAETPPADQLDDAAETPTSPVLSSTRTSGDDGRNRLGAIGIVSMSVGAAFLVVVAAAVRRRAAAAALVDDGGLSNISSSMGPSQSEGV